jgi:hypothetical protein
MNTIEVIPKILADRLEAHARTIREFIVAQRRGAAEQFGYAFLAGRALLQAKDVVPNGNHKRPNAGFKIWVEATFPEISLRTAENWMVFANEVMTRAQVNAPDSPLLLGPGELNGQTHESVLELVPEVMDGKGMMKFMRECRLLRPVERPKHRPRKAVSAHQAAKEKAAQARRVWDRIVSDLETGAKVLHRIERAEDLKRYIDALLDAGNRIREVLKRRKDLE